MSEARAKPDVQFLLEQADWLAPLVRGLLRDAHEVEDVLQETWLRALQHPPRTEGFASPRAWLARVALRIAYRHRERSSARRWREMAVATAEEGVDPEAIAERVRLQRELAEHVLELPDPYRTAITLRYLEGMSCAQLAAQLGIGGTAARKRVSRGLERLRERLDEANGGERAAWKRALATIAWLGPSRAPAVPRSASWVRPAALLAVSTLAGLVALRSLAPRDARPPFSRARSASTEAQHPVLGRDLDLARGSPSAPGAPAALERVPMEPAATSLAQQLDPAHSFLRGRVVDPEGAPVPGASVEARRPDRSAFDLFALAPLEPLADRTHTDERGEFALRVPADGLCDLHVDAEPFALELVPDRRAGDDETIQLRPAARLVVSLVAKPDGAPLAGARFRILALWLPASTQREIARGRSDERGRFLVERLPAGRLLLDVVTEGSADASTVLDVSAGEELERVFRLDAGRTVQGVVLDFTGRPIASAEVVASPGRGGSSLVPESIGRGWKCRSPVHTDASGRFRLVATPGFLESTLFVSARGYGSATVELGTADGDELSIALAPGRSVSGRVLSESGEPVAEARIVAAAREPGPGTRQLDWKAGLSGEDGRFLVEDMRADLAYELRLAGPGHGARVVTLAAAPSERAQQLGALCLPRSPRIAGRVLDSSESPVAGAYVWLGWTSGDAETSVTASRVPELVRTFTRTDQEGRFTFVDVVPGSHSIAASLGGRRTAFGELVVEAGGRREDVRLVFSPARRIAGTVIDAGGRPIANACVLLDPEERVEDPEVRVTGRDGRFEFAPALPGPFGLRAVPNSIHLDGGDVLVHASDLRGIEPGSEDLRIVLPPAEVVTGWLLSPRAEPLANIVLFARDARGNLLTYEYTDADGRFLLRLPPGCVVDLSTRSSAGTESVHTRAVPAGSLDLELVLGEGAD